MNKKQIIIMVTFIALVMVLRNCDFEIPFIKENEMRFDDIEIGEVFTYSRDGFCEKVANNYYLWVDLGSFTSLAKISDEHLNDEWSGGSYVWDDIILKENYIKGYFNDTHLVLCEEKLDFSLVYLSFEFSSEKVVFYEDEESVLTTFGFESTQWHSLCNTFEQRKYRWVKYPDSYIDTVWVSENPEWVMIVDSNGSMNTVITVDNEQLELAVIFRGHGNVYVCPIDSELKTLTREDCLLIGDGLFSSDEFSISFMDEDKLFDFKYERIVFTRLNK